MFGKRPDKVGTKWACNVQYALPGVAIQFNVPKSTFQRRCRKDGPSRAATQKGLGSKRPLELEKEMVAHVKQMEAMLFGFTPKQLRALAFQFAEINNIEVYQTISTKKRRLPATIGFGDSYHATENCHYGQRKLRQLLERRVSTE